MGRIGSSTSTSTSRSGLVFVCKWLGGPVLGLMFPSARPQEREESNLLPIRPAKLQAGYLLNVSAILVGGIAADMSQPVSEWLMNHKLPMVPEAGPLHEYVRTASAGWLDSKINEGGLFRHAYPGAFGAHPAGDAVAMMDWLAARCDNPRLKMKLVIAQKLARSKLTAQDIYSSVGHIKTPVAALLYGDANEAAARAAQQGKELLKRFDAKGRVIYDQHGGLDLARTNEVGHANGLTANGVVGVLEAAALSGGPGLLEGGLQRLDQISHYGDP